MEEILDFEEQKDVKLDYAGFWIRFFAVIIDLVIITSVEYTLGFFLNINFLGGFTLSGSLFNNIGQWLYYSLMESSSVRGTLGKKVMGIQVTDLQGNQISFLNATGRYFAKIPSAIILGIGFLMVVWTEKKQGLHDKLADTVVIKNKSKL